MKQIKRRYKMMWAVIGLLLVSFLVGAFDNSLSIRCYSITSDKIENPVIIVQISDLHSQIFGKDQQDLLDLIMMQNPDIILLTGDIVDDVVPRTGAGLFLQGIQDICPIYYVTGNHEYWSKDIGTIREMLLVYDIKILSDEYELLNVNGNKLLLGGVEDPAKKRYEQDNYNQTSMMARAFSDIPIDGYNILLAHRPEHIEEYRSYAFDLVLSGHAHGGQFRIPYILNGLYAPNQGWVPKYAGGLYEYGALSHIVSRGVGNNVPVPRIFNPPEVVVIRLSNSEVIV